MYLHYSLVSLLFAHEKLDIRTKPSTHEIIQKCQRSLDKNKRGGIDGHATRKPHVFLSSQTNFRNCIVIKLSLIRNACLLREIKIDSVDSGIVSTWAYSLIKDVLMHGPTLPYCVIITHRSFV